MSLNNIILFSLNHIPRTYYLHFKNSAYFPTIDKTEWLKIFKNCYYLYRISKRQS